RAAKSGWCLGRCETKLSMKLPAYFSLTPQRLFSRSRARRAPSPSPNLRKSRLTTPSILRLFAMRKPHSNTRSTEPFRKMPSLLPDRCTSSDNCATTGKIARRSQRIEKHRRISSSGSDRVFPEILNSDGKENLKGTDAREKDESWRDEYWCAATRRHHHGFVFRLGDDGARGADARGAWRAVRILCSLCPPHSRSAF